MAKSVKLLLVENVDSLGIVGDVVNVRIGYARNFLLPRNLATAPSADLVASLGVKRAEAQKQVALQRKQREETTTKLKGVEITLVRSCNDQGILYGAITQQDIASALGEQGHVVRAREVRIAQTIKRVDHYDVHVKLDTDLDAIVKVHVKADRELDNAKKDEPEAAQSFGDDRADPRDRMEDRRAARRNALDEAINKALSEKPKGFGGGDKSSAPAEGSKEGKSEKGGKKGDGEKKGKKKAE
ncbi:MAG: 50S ribosomal protein L9 [Phycisphaerales bacterium]